jgi:ubiquinone/menaquinone biosynthesis C-methylase UbiE
MCRKDHERLTIRHPLAVSVHETARRGFASAAGAYEESRPTYPPEAIAWLAAQLELGPGRTVVDLAAGTGKLTRLLTPTGATVIAIEPVDEMRDALRRTAPAADARPATAEQTGLPDSSADAVTVAQAFHWFDGPAALDEIDRILRPAGKLALIWNVRDLDHPTQRAVEDLFAPYRGDTPSHRSGRWRDAFEVTGPFTSTEVRQFANLQMLDADALARRVESTSFIAELPDPERRRVLEEARHIAHDLPERFVFPYTTEVEIFERLVDGRSTNRAPIG